jgi:hypothetical protein
VIHKEAAEDTATTKTCPTGADANRTISEVVPGQYWVMGTAGSPSTTPGLISTSPSAPGRPSAL